MIRPFVALTDEDGNTVRLKKGAEVEVTVEADEDATTPDPTTPKGNEKK